MTRRRCAIVFVVDRLHAGYLAPYGNAWLPTPTFSSLAAQSLLVEGAVTDSPDLFEAYRSYWSGEHALARAVTGAGSLDFSLAMLLQGAGVATELVTDERRLLVHPFAGDFGRLERVEAPDDVPPATDVEQTQTAELVYAALDRLEAIEGPSLLWIHARGPAGPWDAPYDLRERLADEEDPPPPEETAPPEIRLTPDHDPDVVLGWTQAYGGQVMLLDMALSALLEALPQLPTAAETLLVVTSPRGYPLGEHGRVGACDHALYGELVQTPLFIRFPDGLAATHRTLEVVQPPDLFSTLLDWFGVLAPRPVWGRTLLPVASEDAPFPPRAAVCVTPQERAIRTAGWHYRERQSDAETSAASGELTRELFVKPDDRWEVNEVLGRCPEIGEQMAALAERFAAAVVDPTTREDLVIEEELMKE